MYRPLILKFSEWSQKISPILGPLYRTFYSKVLLSLHLICNLDEHPCQQLKTAYLIYLHQLPHLTDVSTIHNLRMCHAVITKDLVTTYTKYLSIPSVLQLHITYYVRITKIRAIFLLLACVYTISS